MDKPYGQLLYALLYERKYTIYKYTFHVVNCSSYISRSMQRFLENCDYSVMLVNQTAKYLLWRHVPLFRLAYGSPNAKRKPSFVHMC